MKTRKLIIDEIFSLLIVLYLEFMIHLLVILSDTYYQKHIRVRVFHLMFSFHLKYNYERFAVFYSCMHEVVFNGPNRLREIQQVQIG